MMTRGHERIVAYIDNCNSLGLLITWFAFTYVSTRKSHPYFHLLNKIALYFTLLRCKEDVKRYNALVAYIISVPVFIMTFI